MLSNSLTHVEETWRNRDAVMQKYAEHTTQRVCEPQEGFKRDANEKDTDNQNELVDISEKHIEERRFGAFHTDST